MRFRDYIEFFALIMIYLVVCLPSIFAATISDLNVTVTSNSADISWNTSESVKAYLHYGTTKAYGAYIPEKGYKDKHEVKLINLQPEQIYYFMFNLTNESGSVTAIYKGDSGDDFSFTTAEELDTQAPLITGNISIDFPSASTARIAWETDESSNSFILYGISKSSLNETAYDASFVTMHSVSVPAEKDVLYYFKVRSCDESGNCVEKDDSDNWFVGGQERKAPDLEVTVPETSSSKTLSIKGVTSPYTRVFAYINGEAKSQKNCYADGNFSFSLSIDKYQSPVTISFKAINQFGLETISEGHIVEFGFSEPVLVVHETPSSVNVSSLLLNGTVNEEVTLEITVSNHKDSSPPAKVKNLNLVDKSTSFVKLSWDSSMDSDFYEYLIYRNNILIDSTNNNYYQDGSVGSAVTYQYAISAVDTSCNIGERSSILTVTTDSGGSNEEDNVSTEMSCSASVYSTSKTVNGSWSETVSLAQGTNIIKIEAINKYGLSSVVSRTVKIDTDAPEILSHNLRDITPTYNRGVTIRGSVSEEATVYVYMNGEESPSYSAETDDNFDFKVDAMLSMTNVETTGNEYSSNNSGYASVSGGFGFINNIKLIAVDTNGMSSDPVEESVEYMKCSRGNWFTVSIEDPTTILTPRLIIEGVAQVNMNVDIKWSAGDYYNASISDVSVHLQDLSIEDRKKWDVGWVNPSITCMNKKDTNGVERLDSKSCYIQFKIHAQDPGAYDDEKNWTMYDKEENISNHRLGECAVGGFGCLKIPFYLKISFDTNANTGFSTTSEPNEQITCAESYTAIDRRIPTDYIPEWFLQNMIELLNNSINAIDKVLEPLKTITLWTLYGCMALMGVDFLMNWQESYNCKFNQLATILSGDSFSIGVAQVGMCSSFYDDSEKRDYCQMCEDSIRRRVKFERGTMQHICDRIFCPSPMSFQKFYENSATKWGKSVGSYNWNKPEKGSKSKNSFPELKGFDDNAASYDCAVAASNEINVNDYLKEYVTKGSHSIMGLSSSEKSTDDSDSTVDCNDLHIPSAECCKASYMQRWDSACLAMDEFKESACIYASFTKNPSWVGESKENSVKCNVLWNSVAGFCEPDGSAKADLLKLNKFYIHPNCIEDFDEFKKGNEKNVVFRVMPSDSSNPDSDFIIEAGYVTSDLNLASTTEIAEKGESSVVNSQLNFIPFTNNDNCPSDFTHFFDMDDSTVMKIKEPDSKDSSTKEPSKSETDSSALLGRTEGDRYNYDAFAQQLAKISCTKIPSVFINDDDDWDAKECDTTDLILRDGRYFEEVKKIHADLAAKAGQADKDYVADPTSSFARSLQCVCLPAIKAFLQKYRNIMMVVKNCFQTILVTGDGSAGICRQAISIYVCDFLYDLIKCFSEKYSSSGGQDSFAGSFGNFLGAMTDSVNNVNSRISNRYSGNQLFNAIYGEGKIAHAVCMWAFTGTWELDFAAMIEDEYAMPIASTGAIYPCERRFISYNQVSGGYATFAYNFAVLLVAGADLSYEVQLKCSTDGFSCNPQEGFSNGRCDCYQGVEKMRGTTIRGTLLNGETLEDEYFEVVQDNIRYDHASFTWSYTDNKGNTVTESTNCTFNQVGGSPPAFCSFDLGTSSYTCNINSGTESYAKFDGDPSADYGNRDYFKVGDRMRFDLPITYKAPQETECYNIYCAHSKFATVEIRYNDQTVCKSDVLSIELEGKQSVNIEGCELKKSHFENQVSISSYNGIMGSGYPQDITISERPSYTSDRVIFLGMIANKPWVKVTEISYTQARSEISQDSKPSGSLECEYDETMKTINCGSGSQRISFSLSTTPSGGNWVWAWFLDVDSKSCDPNNVYQFSAIARIHPAKESYGLYEYNPDMVYSYNNQRQERSINFDVKCSDSSEAEGEGKDDKNNCPDPMYEDWTSSEYSSEEKLGGKSTCFCGDDICNNQNKDGKGYCVNDKCQSSPAKPKACLEEDFRVTYEDNLDDIYGYKGKDAKCSCDSSLCMRSSSNSKYCIQGYCYSLPGCVYDEVAKEDCICVAVPLDSGKSLIDSSESLICKKEKQKCLKYEGKCLDVEATS